MVLGGTKWSYEGPWQEMDPKIPIMVLTDTIWSFQVLNRVLYLSQHEAPKKGALKYTFFLECGTRQINKQLSGCWFGFANVLKTFWRQYEDHKWFTLETCLSRLGDVFASSWRRFYPVLETFLPCLWRRFHPVLETSSGRSDCGI